MSNFYNYVPMNSKCRVNSLRGQEEYSTIVVFSSNPATFWMPVPTNTLNIFLTILGRGVGLKPVSKFKFTLLLRVVVTNFAGLIQE